MIDVSVIIVNYNTRDFLRECLLSVVSSGVSEEIIVVDNASTDGSVEMVLREFPQVILRQNRENERFAKPNNDAMRIAKGRYFFLLNSDASLKPQALERLIAYMDQHSEVGVCGPQLLNPDGTIQPSCRGFVSLWTHCCDMLALDRLFPRSSLFAGSEMTFFDHRSERKVDHVTAAAIIVRREVVETVGMFDESFSIYYNDLDWSLRIKRSGWKIVFFPEAQVVHHLGSTARPMMSREEIFREQYDNILHFYRKHYGAWAIIVYRILLFIGFIPRTLYWMVWRAFDRSEQASSRFQFSYRSLRYALGQ